MIYTKKILPDDPLFEAIAEDDELNKEFLRTKIEAQDPEGGAIVTFVSSEFLEVLRNHFKDKLSDKNDYLSVTTMFPVRIEGWNGEYLPDTFAKQFAPLAKVLERPIVVRCPHKAPMEEALIHQGFEDSFVVALWSANSRETPKSDVKKIEGKTDICHDSAYDRSFVTWSPIMSSDGVCIGDITPDTLYIFFDAIHQGNASEKYIIDCIVSYAVQIVKSGCGISIESVSTKTVLDELSAGLTENFKRRIPMNREFTTSPKVVIPMILVGDEADRVVQSQLEAFEKNEKIECLRVEDSKLLVKTKDLVCIDDRTSRPHYIGPMEIVVDNAQTELTDSLLQYHPRWPDKKFHEAFLKVRSSAAAHVSIEDIKSERTKCCYGSASEIIKSLLVQKDYPSLVSMAIGYLESANTQDSLGKQIHLWPMVGESIQDWQYRISNERHRDGDNLKTFIAKFGKTAKEQREKLSPIVKDGETRPDMTYYTITLNQEG